VNYTMLVAQVVPCFHDDFRAQSQIALNLGMSKVKVTVLQTERFSHLK